MFHLRLVSDPSYSVIIPAYNEENRIKTTIRELEENIHDLKEIVVVFDGYDNTPDVARNAGNKVTVLEYKKRLGKGGAILEGFKAAKGDVICFTDADGASPWYEVKKICSLVSEENQAVVGSRWVRSSMINKKEPLFNRISSRLFHYIVYAFLGIKTKDTQCGLKAFSADVANKLSQRVKVTNRTIDVALLYHLKKMGIKPMEVGIEWSHDENTRMPIFKVIPLMFITIIGLRLINSERVNKRVKQTLEEIYREFDFY